MPPTPVVLIASVGNSDLQVVLQKDGKYYRSQVHGDVRRFHDYLLDSSKPYVVDDTLWDLPVAPDKLRYFWNGKKGEGSIKDPSFEPYRDANGKLVLVPPKLAGTVTSLVKQKSECHVVAAIVFNTNRSESLRGKKDFEWVWLNEPYGAGPILAEWLADKFNLEYGNNPGAIGPGKAGWINLLDGKMTQEGPGRDSPVNREAVRRLDETIREAASFEKGPWACLMTGGGIPVFKEPLNACAKFRFQGRVFSRVTPEVGASTAAGWLVQQDDTPNPAESFRFRSHAAKLVQIGDFSGAYGAVKWLESDTKEKIWVDRLRIIADYMAGLLSNDHREQCPKYLRPLMRPKVQSLLAGVRVEAALCTKRIPEAVLWTANFFDAALIDFIGRFFEESTVDGETSCLKIPRNFDIPKLLLDDEYSKPCLGLKRSDNKFETYKVFTGFFWDEKWLSVIKQEPLSALNEALKTEIEYKFRRKISPKDSRNIITHKSLTPETMSMMQQVFAEARLWNVDKKDSAPKDALGGGRMEQALKGVFVSKNLRSKEPSNSSIEPGAHFLGVDLVQNVLAELNVKNPAALYHNLVQGVINDLADHKIE
jgi:hypothetical protein